MLHLTTSVKHLGNTLWIFAKLHYNTSISPSLIPPLNRRPGRQKVRPGREVGDPGTVVLVVMAAVGELFLEALADEEAVIGVDREVTGIEEGVEVGPEEEAVADFMGTALRIGSDMGGFQDG